MDRNKVIICVAPVSHTGKAVPPGCRNPLTAEEVAAEVADCAAAGAGMVHLHVRDEAGAQTFKLDVFRNTLDLFTARTDIIIQGSTGGLADLSLEERCVCLDESRVEVASLNMGSVNFGEGVYINTFPDIRFWAKRMKERGVMPELECFDLGMIENSFLLADEGLLESPMHFNFCLGTRGALSATARNLSVMRSGLKGDMHWGLTVEGMPDFSMIACALSFGASVVRIGFEDSFYYSPGKLAATNAVLVEQLVRLIVSLGYEVATPAEARQILNLSNP
jgi:3-keto-5-aminohexanoate cleavage enzyme